MIALVESGWCEDSGEAADETDHALLAQLTPGARKVRAGSGALGTALPAGFDVAAAAARVHPACALLPQACDWHGVSTFVWRRERPFHPQRLYAALEDLTCAAARSRGRFWLADRPDTLLSWDAAGGALRVESAGPWLAALPDAAWEMVPAERRLAASASPPRSPTPDTEGLVLWRLNTVTPHDVDGCKDDIKGCESWQTHHRRPTGSGLALPGGRTWTALRCTAYGSVKLTVVLELLEIEPLPT